MSTVHFSDLLALVLTGAWLGEVASPAAPAVEESVGSQHRAFHGSLKSGKT